MAIRAARHTTYYTSFLTDWHGCSSSHTCRGSSCTEPGWLCCVARLLAEAPVQIQKTGSRSCSACESVAMRLSVARHKGKPSPTSWAICGPLLPPHHAGVGATKLPSSYSPMGASKANSAHCCQASILAVWLGCMRQFVAACTVNVEEPRLSVPGDDCIAPCWCCWSCWGCC